MFDSCQESGGSGGPRCADVAEKLVQLFGWRQTYKVEKLQRSMPDRATTRISITRTCGRNNDLRRKYSLDSSARHQQPAIKADRFHNTSSKIYTTNGQNAGTESWVAVHNLQSQSGGGILDPDDRLNDVADDREQIIANFEDGDGVHHGGGDGASGSSIGTASPDIFHDPEHKYSGSGYPSRTDIEVTGEQIASGILSVPLQVRRGSEPALHQLPISGTEPPGPRPPSLHDPTKRWSAAPIILGDLTATDASPHIPCDPLSHTSRDFNRFNYGAPGYLSPDWTREHEKDDDEDDDTSFQRIARDGSNRLSMQFLGNGTGYRWADAAERTSQTNSAKHKIHVSTSLPRDHRRKEPLGQANNSTSPTPPPTLQNNRLTVPVNQPETDEELAELIVIRNEPGPLGIHVVPDYDRLGKDRGLVVQGIEPGGRIDRDGKLAIHDRIIEINGQNLLNMSFQRVQEMFKLSLIATELRLKVVKHRVNGEQLRKPPAPVYPKTGLPVRFPEDKENVAMVEVEEQSVSGNTKLATVSPTKKLPSGTRNPKSLLTANTRKIGRKIELELTKGVHGLGFSITTRDNPAGGNCPIYIKNILPKVLYQGAAVEDGRLKPGDRLLEVNNVEMTGKSQAEAVAVLRNAPPGSKVRIVVSRQEEAANGPVLPREIGADDSEQARNSNTISIPVSKTNSLPITITNSLEPAQTIHHQKSNSVNIVTSNTKSYPPVTNNPSPPAIPPLPESMLSARNHKSATERIGSVAKIISQFQEASKTSCNNHPSDKCNDDSLLFPWKHREILTFDIPVYDSEKAGLGVSVKGKTTQSSNGGSGSADLGIFVKSVLHGGAASRDKRLRTNDQLLNVNGVSLLQQSNAEAMETLRRAMLHTEGPVPGSITLTIARRAHSPAPPGAETNNSKGSNHWTSQGSQEISTNNHSSESNMESSTGTDNSGTSESSGNTVIFLPYKTTENSSQSLNTSLQSPPPKNTPNYASNNWNPVIDRITGQSSKNHPHNNLQQLRNESYYMATHHDTWNTSMLMNTLNSDKYSSPTVNLPSGETVIIEEEYNPPPPMIRLTNSSSSNILENRNETEPDGKASVSSSTCGDKSTASVGGPANSNTDVTYASQLSLENPAGFSRDAFGRQSMSEKRHATLDAKNTGTYQRNKKLREEREKMKPKDDADKLGQLGPSLGMKKSSSLESLQTMVQEIQMQEEEDPAYSYRGGPGALKVIRGRGCDESFRAAVDVDYNNHMDPNHRAETSAKKHWLLDPPEGHSGEVSNEREIDGFSNVRGGLRQSSLNAVLDSKHKSGSKKKPGILKGIGSMFRFGKHRKTESIILEQPLQHFEQTPEDADIIQVHEAQSQDVQTNKENEKQINEQLQRSLRENHSSSSLASNKYYVRSDPETNELQNPATSSPSRSEKVHQLRSQHQQRHAERHGQYPNDEREEHYEQVIRQRMEQPATGYENYRQMGRPGSRSGIADPVRFNHYVNYDELQHQLSRKQHQYHSQRQPRSELQQRPVSNFYEYESIQSFMHSRGRLPPSHVPSPQAPPAVLPEEVNSNSLPRYHQVVGSRHQHHNNNNSAFTQHQRVRPYQSNPSPTSYHHPPPPQYHQHPQSSQSPRYVQQNSKQHSMQINGRHRGPFVTHVTIGNEGNNKATGSKV